MGLREGKRGATMAPTVEKPTAITEFSTHSSNTGTPRCAWLKASNRMPSAVSAKETAHVYQASQVASLRLILEGPRPALGACSAFGEVLLAPCGASSRSFLS